MSTKARAKREPGNDKVLIDAGKKVLDTKWSGWTFERLICHPRESMAFCKQVRESIGTGGKLPDHVVLWTMLNGRKRGDFSHGLKGKQS